MIELRDVRVVYGRTLALEGLGLQLQPGVTGLFGPNGAGKSTLLRVIAGLLRVDRGQVTLDGRPIDISDEDFRRRIGYVGHATGLYRHLTITENLRLFARLYGVGEERIAPILAGVGLAEREATRVESLSAGLKRRAAIARALLQEPHVLLLDEPYANLDDEASDLVTEAITSWRDTGRYAVIATHGAKRIKPFVDASVILQRGRVVSHRVRTDGDTTT